jgi:hypothetical protein
MASENSTSRTLVTRFFYYEINISTDMVAPSN